MGWSKLVEMTAEFGMSNGKLVSLTKCNPRLQLSTTISETKYEVSVSFSIWIKVATSDLILNIRKRTAN